MAQTIKLKRSATAGNTPTTSQLALGELGINTTDGKLFLKKSVSGTESVVDVGGLPLSGGSLTGSIDVTGSVTSTGLTAVNSTDTQGKFSGWSVIGANSSSGAIELGQDSPYQGIMSYVADASTRFLFDNTYGSTASTFEFRTNTAATAKTHLKIEGSGDISFYNSAGTSQNLFWDSSTSRLGLGTTVPTEKLHLQSSDVGSGSGEVAIKMTVPASQISAQNEIRSGVTSGTNPYMSFAVRETSAPYSTVEKLRINADGSSVFSGSVTTGSSLVSTNAIVDSVIAKTSGGNVSVKTNAGGSIARFNNNLSTDFFGSIDVTGTVTADGLTVDGGTASPIINLSRSGTYSGITFSQTVTNVTGAGADLSTYSLNANTGYVWQTCDSGGTTAKALYIAPNKDISFYNDSAAQGLFWDSSTSRLGLGTTNPAQFLHLTSTGFAYARLNNSSYTGIDIGQHTNGNTYFNLRDNKAQVFLTNNTERLSINADGSSVFSGAVTSTGLTVNATGSSYPTISHSNGNRIQLQPSYNYYNAYSHIFSSLNGTTNHLTIANTGNVNIPNGGLMVGATSAPTSANSNGQTLVLSGSGNTGMSIVSGTSSNSSIMFADGYGGTAGYRGHIKYNHADDSLNFATAATANRLTIDSSGNASFSGAVTADKFKLSSTNFIDSPTTSIIRYSVGSGDHVFFSGSTSNSELLRINGSSANVNIPNGSLMVGSTTAPTSALTIGSGAVNGTAITINSPFTYNNYADLIFSSGGTTTYNARIRATTPGDGTRKLEFMTAKSAAENTVLTLDGDQNALFSGSVTVSKGGSTAAHGDTDLLVRHNSATSTTAQAQILAGNAGYSNLYFSDTDSYNVGGFIYNHASNYLATNVNGSEKMRIDSQGRVGIGNAVASSMNAGANQLVVGSGSTGQGITLYSSTSTAGSIHFADGTSGDAAYRGQLVYNHNGDYMAILTAATERMRIDSSGNLLVGKTVQGLTNAGFEVAQTGQASATQSGASCLRLNRLSSDGQILQFRKDGSTVGGIGTLSSDLYLGTGNTTLTFTDGSRDIVPTGTNGAQDGDVISLGNANNRFKDLHLSGAIASGAITSTGLTVDGSGTIASFKRDAGANGQLDLSFPAQKPTFDVSSDFFIKHQTNQILAVKATGIEVTGSVTATGGDLTIEDNSPFINISNTGENAGGIKMYDSGGAATQYFNLTYDSGASNTVGFDTGASGEYAFSVNGASMFNIASSGNVGINITSPAATLHTVAKSGTTALLVTGAASNNIASFYTSGGSQAMTLTADGNLLVGTTSTAINTSTSVAGHNLFSSGYAVHARSGQTVMSLNRQTNYGTILDFRLAGSVVGSIGGFVGYSYFGNSGTQSNGIIFTPNAIEPFNSSTAASDKDGDINLGASNQRFKDLYLSGGVYGGGAFSAGTTGNGNFFAEGAQHIFRKGSSGSYAEFGRFDTSGNFLVGKTAANFTVAGHEIKPNGFAGFTRDGGAPVVVNRLTNDGGLVEFYRGGTSVGSIGTGSASLTRLQIGSGDTNLFFQPDADYIGPSNGTAPRDAAIDLGYSVIRWKDLYLSGNATAQKLTLTKSPVGTFTIEVDGTNTGQPNLIVKKGTSEALRVDNSNNLLVGTTNNNAGGANVVGHSFGALGYISSTRDSNWVAQLNRKTNDGDIAIFKKDGSTVGSWKSRAGVVSTIVLDPRSGQGAGLTGAGAGSDTARHITPTNESGVEVNGKVSLGNSTNSFRDAYLSGTVNAPYIGATNTGLYFNGSYNAVVPYRPDTDAAVDNYLDLGMYSYRFDDVFATNGTIQTSDRNEKQDIEFLTEAEERVAVAAKGLLKKFRWKSSVAEKGDDARIHFGIIAQDLQAAFEAEGLDAGRYAMFTSDTWTNEDGEEQTRMGVRYSELLAFIISAI